MLIRVTYAIAILGMLLTGCSKSVDSKSKSFTYPLALGNQWTYEYVGTWEHGDPLEVDTTETATFQVTVTRVDTIRPGVLSYTMRGIEVGSTMPDGITEFTYLNLPEGMYFLSWNTWAGAAFVLPRRVPLTAMVVSKDSPLAGFPNSHGLMAALSNPAGLITAQTADLADTLPLVLAYPQRKGLVWTYYESSDGDRTDKVIEGRETITTPAGSFSCWRIRRINGGSWADLHEVDYISPEGLIRRRSNIYFSSTGDWIYTYDLISFELH